MRLWSKVGLATLLGATLAISGCSSPKDKGDPIGENGEDANASFAADENFDPENATIEEAFREAEARSSERDALLQQLIREGLAAEAAARQAQYDELKGDIAGLDTRLTNLEGRLEQEILDRQAADTQLRTDYEAALAAQKTLLEGKIEANADDIAALETELEQEIGDLKTQLGNELAAVRQEMDEQKTEITNEYTAAIDDLGTELRGRLTVLEGEKDDLKAMLDMVKTRLNAAIGTTPGEIGGLIRQELDALAEDDVENREFLENLIAGNKADIEQKLQDEANLLQGEIDAINTKITDKINPAIGDLAGRLDTAEDRLDGIDEAIANLQDQIDTINDRIDDMAKAILDLQQFQRQTNEELVAIFARLGDMEGDVEDIKTFFTLEEMAAFFGTSVETITAAVNGDEAALTQFRTDVAAEKARVQADLDNLRSDLDLLTSQFEQYKTATDATLVQLGDRLDTLTNELNRVEQEYKAADEALEARLIAKYESAIEQIVVLRARVTANEDAIAGLFAADGAITALRNITAAMQVDLDALEDKVSNEVMTAITEFRTRILNLETNFANLYTQLTNHIADYETTVADLAAGVKANADEINKLWAANANTQAGIAALNEGLNNLTQRVVDLEAFEVAATAELERVIAELQTKANADDVEEQIAELNQKYLDAIGETQELRQEIADEIERLEGLIAQAQADATTALNNSAALQEEVNGIQTELERQRQVDEELAGRLDDLEAYVDDQIAAVRAEAQELVDNMSAEFQEQFAVLAAELADLRLQGKATAEDLVRQIEAVAGVNIDDAAFNAATQEDQDLLVSKYAEMLTTIEKILEAQIYAALETNDYLPDSTSGIIDDKFGDVAANPFCGGITGRIEDGTEMQASSIAFREWYKHLARHYVRELIAGTRTNNRQLDKIFFGVPSLKGSGITLANSIVDVLAPSYALAITAQCDQAVQEFFNNLFYGEGDLANDLRDTIAGSDGVKMVVLSLQSPYAKLTDAANVYDNKIREILGPLLANNLERLNQVMREGDGDKPSVYALISRVLDSRTEDLMRSAYGHATLREMHKIAANLKAELGEALEEQNQRFQELEDRLTAFAEETDKKINQLAGGQAALFSLVATMAQRLGYEDVLAKAKEEAAKAAVDIDLSLNTVRLGAVSHAYTYAGKFIKWCKSSVDTGIGVYEDPFKCRGYRTTQVVTTTVTKAKVTTTVFVPVIYGFSAWRHQRLTDPTKDRLHNKGVDQICEPKLVGLQAVYPNTRACRMAFSSARGVSQFGYKPGVKNPAVNVSTDVSFYNVSTEKNIKYGAVVANSGDLKFAPYGPYELAGYNLETGAQEALSAYELVNVKEGTKPEETFGAGAFVINLIDAYAHTIKICNFDDTKCVTIHNPNTKEFRYGSDYRILGNVFNTGGPDGLFGYNGQVWIHMYDDQGVEKVKRRYKFGSGMKKELAPINLNIKHLQVVKTIKKCSDFFGPRPSIDKVLRLADATKCAANLFAYKSPIVLDLSGQDLVEPVALSDSKVLFDVDNNGLADQPAWIKPSAGFLALDRNGDGIINHGGELFGDATFLKNGLKAGNGYEALQEFDSHKNGIIDARDEVFGKLVVWQDRNMDGVSQRDEMKPVAAYGITGISTDFASVSKEEFRRGTSDVLFMYQSRFFGPEQCGSDGCKTWDLYFGVKDSNMAGAE